MGLGEAVSLYPRDDTEVTLKSNIDYIEEALMNVLQAILKYNTQNKNITGIVAFKEEEE